MTRGKRQGGRPGYSCCGLGKLGRAPRRGAAPVAVALGVGLLLAGQGRLAADTPAGMVPYDHPVYHNGVKVLWHGAWRGSQGKAARQVAPQVAVAKPALPAPAPTPAAKEFSILADPGDLRASRMANDFAAVMSANGASGRAIVGSTSPNGLGNVAKTDMAGFAIVSLDSLLFSAKADPEWMKRDPFIARLAPEPLEVIAPREIKSIADLQGRTVSFGDLDSATSICGRMLFSRLGVAATQMNEPLSEALEALAAGKRAAVVVLGAEGSRVLDGFGGDGRFHIVSIPWSSSLEPVYAPARVSAADRPNLVGPAEPVETVGEPMALIALEAAPGSQRADALGRLAQVFLDNYDEFLSDDRDAHWREVNLAAEGSWPFQPWPRLAAAQSWLDGKKASADASLDAFRASAKSAGDSVGGPTAADSDQLYESLTRWRGLMQ
jgi:TRAP-type uncharacterized transport system substrate-binding protein